MARARKNVANIADFLAHIEQVLETHKGNFLGQYLEPPLLYWDDGVPVAGSLNTKPLLGYIFDVKKKQSKKNGIKHLCISQEKIRK